MSEQDETQSVVSLDRLDATTLSYNEMTVDPSGSIMSREVKLEWRQKLGYCTSCTERPVLLFTFKRSRMNPLWKTKEARSVPGECDNGVCLRCQKEKQQLVQQQQATAAKISAPATNYNALPGNRQVSNSTLDISRSNSSDSMMRFSSYHQQQQQHQQSRIGRHSARETSSKPPPRSVSNDDLLLTSAHNVGSFVSGNNGSSQRSETRRLSGSQRLARSDHRAAILPRHTQEQNATSHFHPSTIDEMNQSMSELLSVPTLISPQKRPMSSRQMSTTDVSVASSLSCDFSVRSLGEESMSDIQQHTADGHHTASGTTTVVSDTSAENNIKEQLRGLLLDMKYNPSMAADVLLHAMKSNADKAGLQSFCMENMHMPTQVVLDTGVYRGVLQAMKNHRHSLKIQRAGLALLLQWSEEDELRTLLIGRGLCELISPILSLHFRDMDVVQDVTSLLRLVTLEEEGRALCQSMDVSQLLARGMQSHANQAGIQTDGCAVLSNLAVDVKHKTVAVVSPAILDTVTSALLTQVAAIGRGQCDQTGWTVVRSACFTIKNFIYQQTNLRELASRDDLLQGLETVISHGPRRSKDAVTVLEKLQLSRVQDESLQSQVLETLQYLWNKSVPEAIQEILQVWQEHDWSVRILIVSLHQIQDMLQSNHYTDPDQLDRIMDCSKPLLVHQDKRVVKEVERLRVLLAGDAFSTN
eukprot:scaffold2383_cov161-Amphora_coffeaeformis.AAC.2